MHHGLLHLRIKRKTLSVSNDRAALPRTNGRDAKVSFGWTVDIYGITLSHIVALTLLVPVTAASVGALLALILCGLAFVSNVTRHRSLSGMQYRRSFLGIDFRPARPSIAKMTLPRC